MYGETRGTSREGIAEIWDTVEELRMKKCTEAMKNGDTETADAALDASDQAALCAKTTRAAAFPLASPGIHWP